MSEILVALIAFLKAAPALDSMIKDLQAWAQGTSQEQIDAFISDLGSAMSLLKSSKTDADKQAAAKAIADTIAGL